MHSACTAHAQHMHSTCKAHAGAGLVAACLTQTRTLTLITDYYHLEVGQRLDVRHREDVVVVALDERFALALRAHLWAWAGVLQGATARVCLSREGSRCQASQAGAAKGPSAGPHYQLACRPSAKEAARGWPWLRSFCLPEGSAHCSAALNK